MTAQSKVACCAMPTFHHSYTTRFCLLRNTSLSGKHLSSSHFSPHPYIETQNVNSKSSGTLSVCFLLSLSKALMQKK